MRKFIFFLLCSIAIAQNPYRAFNNFNAGELSPLLSAREDLAKYQNGCSIMENLIPIPQGGAQKRPGTKFIIEVKDSDAKTRLLPFEYSTSQSYIIEAGNQYMRFCTDDAQVTTDAGTEDLTGLDGSPTIISHWLLNDNLQTAAVLDDEGNHGATASTDTEDLHLEGKVGTGCFDFDGSHGAYITSHADFSFIEGVDGDFSITAWANIVTTGTEQVILSKMDETTGSANREWELVVDASRKLSLRLFDDSLDLYGDLISLWRLDDNLDTAVVVDATGNHNGVVEHWSGTDYTSYLNSDGKIDDAFGFLNKFVFVGDRVIITDHADFTYGNGAADTAFSISAWIWMDDATSFPILTKFTTGQAEWMFATNADDKLVMNMFDDSPNVYIGRMYNTAITSLEETWIHVVMTYSGNEASSGINLYINGADVDSADLENGAYTAMHDETSDVHIAFSGAAGSGPYDAEFEAEGFIDSVMFFDKALSANEVLGIYNSADGLDDWSDLYVSRTSNAALDTGWNFVTATYEGENAAWTGASAASHMLLYVNGVAINSTASNLAHYVKMEATAALPRIGAIENAAGTIGKMWDGRLDDVALFNDKLTATAVASLYTSAATSGTAFELSTPYLTADLFELKYEQSADVLYITHPDYETRKLSRLGNDDWVMTVFGAETGPFRTQNDTVSYTIASSATTGTVTLTAAGGAPFVSGTTAGHVPSGSAATSKSQTGALFRLIHPLDTLEYTLLFTDSYDDVTTEGVSWLHCGTLFEGAGWTLVTDGTWSGTLEIQRNYTIGAAHGADGWETVLPYTSPVAANERNVSTSGTEDDGDADYRAILVSATVDDCLVIFTTDQTEVAGIVEITSVASPTSATGTVIKTLGSTDATHKWSEGSWSNYRGWPQTVTFFEDRLMFGGNTSQPDTIWGSVTSDYQNMTAGADDDDAVIFTLSSRQVNVIEWLVGKDKLLIGTSGAEWTIAGGTDEPLTPSNVIAKQHSTYGSANLQADLANESVLFFQRGKEKMRELAYNWELDSYVAPDMTILANLVTDSGIDDTAFQKTPDSILWCIRNDGELPVFSYERQENITAWSRMVTHTNLAGTLTDSDFESIARISGSPEDEIWVIVERTISSSTARYIEQFQPRDFGSDADDAYYVDCGITYDSDPATTITGLTHLIGETVAVLGDGVVQASKVVDGSGEITITSASTVQVGLPYEVHLRTMPLSWIAQGPTIQGIQKRISEVVANWYVSGDFSIGRDVDTLGTMSISGQTTSQDRITFPPGYSREGYVYIYQKSPEPLTLLALMTEFDIN